MVYLTKKVSHDLLGLQFHRFIGVVSHLSTSSNNPNGSLQEEALCKETEKSPILYYHPAFGMGMEICKQFQVYLCIQSEDEKMQGQTSPYSEMFSTH